MPEYGDDDDGSGNSGDDDSGNGEDEESSGGSDERDTDESGATLLSPPTGALTVSPVLCCLAAYWL